MSGDKGGRRIRPLKITLIAENKMVCSDVVSPLVSNSTYTALVWKEGWVVCGGYLDLPGCRFLFTKNPGRCVCGGYLDLPSITVTVTLERNGKRLRIEIMV